MRWALIFAACSSTHPEPPAARAQPARLDASPASPASDADVFGAAGCTLLPQPSKPGHATVEPDDMACMHGDYVFDCPAAFDAEKHHCYRSTAKAWATTKPWCCPGP